MANDAEWLEADGLGGFASGTTSGIRTRRYHALLLAATTPPTGRVVLVNGMEAWLEGDHGRTPLSTQRYAPDVIHPNGLQHLARFEAAPWPRWFFVEEATKIAIEHDLFVARDTCETVLRWRRVAGSGPLRLFVRFLISGRDYHALHHENGELDFAPIQVAGNIGWRPYPGLPAIGVLTNGDYVHAPDWYRNFLYTEERDRGLDCIEDLASPGVFSWSLEDGEAVVILRAGDGLLVRAAAHATHLAGTEAARRRAARSDLARAAESYLVARGKGGTLLAGFPWFTDWGRDTFIAMRGLLLADGRLDEAENILVSWAATVSEGMLPNRFPDQGDTPEFNAVDASLWFVVAAYEFLQLAQASRRPDTDTRLREAVLAIVEGYARGTRFGIRMDQDGLLSCGVAGVQLTWMDAKVGDWVVTPRIGKPVEVQALWINALHIAGGWSPRWLEMEARARAAFSRFADPATGGLFDVIDVDHTSGRTDVKIRPNQVFAVGGLPFPILQGNAARRVVDLVEDRLLTPLGLRTLAPADPAYVGHYRGGPRERDAGYHQGTVWPWLIGPFVEAWLRVRETTQEAKQQARERFLPALMQHLETAGIGHVSEVANGDAPHDPGGCPFQAWSLGELIRARAMVASPGQDRSER